jgi:tRNA G10  N-methylase Trm11
MNELRLQRNLQFLYEDHLARLELTALGCGDFTRDEGDAWLLRCDLDGNLADIHGRSAYVGAVDGRPTVYGELIRPGYQGGRFNRTRSVNQYLTHWIYPYRGKFHPQMVRALFNLLGAKRGGRAWDPFVGSGTAALEASLLGVDCIGTDLSPLCVLLTRVKTQSVHALKTIRSRVTELLADDALDVEAFDPAKESSEQVRDFLQVARMVTFSDVARRGRQAEAAFRRNLTQMLESVQAHATALKHFGIRPGAVKALLADARNLTTTGIAPETIDVIVTSPPYSIALDYVKNDEHALEALGVDMGRLREKMTGVRGRGAHQKMAHYNADMKLVFQQVATALKPGGSAAFVVGDATVDRREITTTGDMTEWAETAGLRLERNIRKIVFGLYSVMTDERILVFRKP